MANRERGEMGLVCEGQSYTLRLTVQACCELEDRTGVAFDTYLDRVNRGRVKELRGVLWAALQDRHEGAFDQPEDVGPVIDALGGARAAAQTVAAFLRLNTDTPDEDGTKSTKPAAKKRGSAWQRLYLDARNAGMSAPQFWSLTLKELWLELAASRQQAKRDRDRVIAQAWFIANLVWRKELPSLKSLLEPDGGVQGTDMKTALFALSAQYGLPLSVTKNGIADA